MLGSFLDFWLGKGDLGGWGSRCGSRSERSNGGIDRMNEQSE